MADLNAQEVLVGNAYGVGLWIAPLGTPLPTDTDTLPVAWKPLGYATEDGIGIMSDRTTTDIMSWQDKSPIRTVTKSVIYSVKASLLQWNAQNLALFFGTAEPTPDAQGDFTLKITAEDTPVEHALIVDVSDAGRRARVGFNRVQLSETGNLMFVQGEATPLETTFKALPINGETVTMIFKNPPVTVKKATVAA